MAGQRRQRHARLQGARPRAAGLRRGDAGRPAGPPRHRPLPLLDHRLLHLGERPAQLPQLPGGGSLALGHNGNLTNTSDLARRVAALEPRLESFGSTTDSDLVTALLASSDKSADAAAMDLLPTLQGAFSLVFMDEHTLYAARDPHGVRPLVLGRLERGWVVASETAALDIVGASFVREVEPGELLAIDEHGVRSQRFAPATPKGCLFEYVYLARPDTTIAGRSVHETRVADRPRARRRGARRRRPRHPGARVRDARPRSATRRPAASPTARAW